jgi:glycosyltransferase involved in cell wall biosynthesis
MFIALSEEIEQELRDIGVPRDRIVRIPNGVDTRRFRPLDARRRETLRAELRFTGRRVALFIGRLESMKGVDALLDAWQDVRRSVPDALLVIMGYGALRASLQSRSVPDVRFVGVVDDPLPYLQAADCFVLPSLGEGLPVALLEAMATELPCVATSIGGTVDVIRPGIDGWLVRPQDSAALAKALVQALTLSDRAQLGAAGRARVLSKFSLEDAADRLSALYRVQACRSAARSAPRATRRIG